MVQLNHDYALGGQPEVPVMHVPKDPFAFLPERAGGNNARKMRPKQANPFWLFGNFRVGANRIDMLQWNFETAAQSPYFVPAFHSNLQLVVRDRYLSHLLRHPTAVPMKSKRQF